MKWSSLCAYVSLWFPPALAFFVVLCCVDDEFFDDHLTARTTSQDSDELGLCGVGMAEFYARGTFVLTKLTVFFS